MSRRDLFHDAVRHSLEKEGWTITDDPLTLDWDDTSVKIDLGAERLLIADRGKEKIAVEIKSFAGRSLISEFHTALGQFIVYRRILRVEEPDRTIFLGIPIDAYNGLFQTSHAQAIVEEESVNLVVYDPANEVIVTWTK